MQFEVAALVAEEILKALMIANEFATTNGGLTNESFPHFGSWFRFLGVESSFDGS
jgi:hypothetical protein